MKRSVMIRLDESDYQLWLTAKAHPANRMYPNALVFVNALKSWMQAQPSDIATRTARLDVLMRKSDMTNAETAEYQRLRQGL